MKVGVNYAGASTHGPTHGPTDGRDGRPPHRTVQIWCSPKRRSCRPQPDGPPKAAAATSAVWVGTARISAFLLPHRPRRSRAFRGSRFRTCRPIQAEFFGRIDTPWDLFVKGYVGGGTSGHSHLNDEDFLVGLGGGPFPYSNTLSPIVDGRIGYRAIDAGYDFLRGSKSERSPATFSSFAALLVTAFYLVLSGAEVATTTPVHHDCDRAHRRHA